MTGTSMPPGIETWLATPEAADQFDPSSLHGSDRAEWANLRTPRRRRDWASSRTLLAAAGLTSNQSSSLSHSHGYAALAVAPRTVAVGVDVEWLAPREFLGMADIAYSEAERALLASITDPQGVCAMFYELWTLKEAFAKALRLPLVDALQQCRFIDAGFDRRADVPTNRHWLATVFAPRPQLRLAVVRVADAQGQLDAPLDTLEWPRPRTSDWPVIRRLSGGGS